MVGQIFVIQNEKKQIFSSFLVDGAVVERGKPRLVQDVAIQVFTTGRNCQSILTTQQRSRKDSITTLDRRRRHSWHGINEYHSVPYYQYTRCVQFGNDVDIQCDLDNEYLISTQEFLPLIREETVDEHPSTNIRELNAQITIHTQPIVQDRVQVSMMTQTEYELIFLFFINEFLKQENHYCRRYLVNQSTSIDTDFIQMLNLDLQTNENILSSIANPYIQNLSSNCLWSPKTIIRNGVVHDNVSVSTGDDYPQWWLQLSTNIILSNYASSRSGIKETSPPYFSIKQDQSIQTDLEQTIIIDADKERQLISITLSLDQNSSSITTSNHYEIIDDIDDGNNARRISPISDHYPRVEHLKLFFSFLILYFYVIII